MFRCPPLLLSLLVFVPSLPAFAQYGYYDVPPPNPYVQMPSGWGGQSPGYTPTPDNPIRDAFIQMMTNPRSSNNSCTVQEGYYVPDSSRCSRIGTNRNGQPIWSCC